MARILVTGGAGYIGSMLVPHLLADGHRVTVLDSFLHNQSPFGMHFEWDTFDVVKGDARDLRVVGNLAKSADIVIPLAALVGAPHCDADPYAARTTNSEAIFQLCDKLSPSQWVLYPNSNSGYGSRANGGPCVEDDPLTPISLYGRLKCDGESAVMSRENSIAFRLATVFGVSPRFRMDLIVNEFVWRAFRDQAITLFEAHFRRNFIYVRDVAGAFCHAIKNFDTMRGLVYNAGDTRANMSKWQLCERIKEHVPGFVFSEAAVGEDRDKRDYLVSNSRLESTGWAPQWSLDDGIAELLKFYGTLRVFQHGNV